MLNGHEPIKKDFGEGIFFIYIPPNHFQKEDIKKLKIFLSKKMPPSKSSKQSGNSAPDIDPSKFISTPKKTFVSFSKKYATYIDGKGKNFKECTPVKSYRGGIVWDRFRKRLTYGNYTVKHPEEWFNSIISLSNIWLKCIPFCQEYIGYTKNFPSRVSIGKGLPFTTSTINHSFQTNYHYDGNNEKGTFAFCFCVRKKGVFGGELILPELGFGIDWQSGGVVLCPFHLVMHGNNKIIASDDYYYNRVSIINYVNKFVMKNARNKIHRNYI